MTFFETFIALLAIAMLLLQVTRRMHLPYPGILAAAGVAVALLPGAPTIPSTATALALFIAPVLIDSAYDFPVGAARRMLLPLIFYAIFAVLITTCVVTLVGVEMAGLPLAVAFTLGAIVAPPDAAAETAVLSSLPVSRRVDTLLKGESLFNDATALLLFGAALTMQAQGGINGAVAVQLGLAVPAELSSASSSGFWYPGSGTDGEHCGRHSVTVCLCLLDLAHCRASTSVCRSGNGGERHDDCRA